MKEFTDREHGRQKSGQSEDITCFQGAEGWLTTTEWLSQRRRESNLFSSRQQLRRVQAKLQRLFPPSLSLLQSLFLSFFFHPLPSALPLPLLTGSRNFTQYVDSRRRGAVQDEAEPGPHVSAPVANVCRAFTVRTLWTNGCALKACIERGLRAELKLKELRGRREDR